MARMVLPFILFCIITPAILFSMPTDGSRHGSMTRRNNSAGCGDSRLSHCGTQKCSDSLNRTNGKQFANLTLAL